MKNLVLISTPAEAFTSRQAADKFLQQWSVRLRDQLNNTGAECSGVVKIFTPFGFAFGSGPAKKYSILRVCLDRKIKSSPTIVVYAEPYVGFWVVSLANADAPAKD